MNKRFSLTDDLTALTQERVGSILVMGAILFLGLGFVDYYVSPDLYHRFMLYRLVISSILIVLYFLNRLKRHTLYQYGIAAAGAVLSAVTIETAILQSGGQNSVYYAALIILTVSCLGFAPISMGFSLLLVALIYAIYFVPIVMTEEIAGGIFISNNAFLIATFAIGLLLRYHHQKLLVSEMRLRTELSEDKRTLELYSCRLKDQVAETSGTLAATEQKYRALFDYANDGIAVLDRFGDITDVNYRFCELHGFEPSSVGRTSFRLFEIERSPGEIDERIRRVLNGESLVYEAEHYRKNGSRILLEISSRAIDIAGVAHIQSFHRDITEKVKLQEQVLQSQKMESLGVLAGGIAHDFQNMLAAILAHMAVLKKHLAGNDFGRLRIKTIEDASKRASQMIQKLLSFARKDSLELVPSDLNRVVEDSVDLLGRALMDKNVKIRIVLDPEPPVVHADPIQLEQAIANLVMNASDAMDGGGLITISTSCRVIAAETSPSSPFLRPGRYAILSIRDQGSGIPPEIIDKIFDPFFTTKPAGKGTGLGLAIVYGIVKSHKGETRLQSRVGEGTTFEIFFPVLENKSFCRIPESVPDWSPAAGVCIVDDDKDVLSFVQFLLEAEGYRVFASDNPGGALELFEAHRHEIDLVLTDMVMPVMNGAELAAEVRKIKPSVKVVGISGYESTRILHEAETLDSFLKKPLEGPAVVACVRGQLNSDKTGSSAL